MKSEILRRVRLIGLFVPVYIMIVAGLLTPTPANAGPRGILNTLISISGEICVNIIETGSFNLIKHYVCENPKFHVRYGDAVWFFLDCESDSASVKSLTETQKLEDGFIFADSDKRYLTPSDISSLNAAELKIA